MIDLNETKRMPLYESVYRQLREEIGSGQRKPGEKLPSKRALAATLGISINTVETAYRQLESEGFIEARDRSGFYVLPLSDLGPDMAPEPRPNRTPPPAAPEIDFAVGAVDEALFPITVWQRLTRASLNMPGILTRGDSLGDPGLREEIARYLARARGVRCDPEQILLGPGTDALLRTLGSLLPESCTFVVENPAYHRAYAHFSRMGHRVIPAQMDDKGVMVEPLRTLDSAVVYTAPSHQYPLGFAMPMGRRTALLAWCAGGGFRYVVEDDYDSEFRYDARPLPSLQSIDRAERVIYLGTMSGVIAPSLRISYMILPPALLRRLRERRDPYSCNVPTLEQYTLREFMRQGYFEKHLGRDLEVYVIRDGQAIVSCAFLLTVEKPMSPAFPNGCTGAVLNVYTLPAFRRRGYAKMIMAALTGGAKRMGLSVVELKATEAGYPLYRATGFSDSPSKYRLMKWTNPDLAQSTPIK